jgi:hypothetical protein
VENIRIRRGGKLSDWVWWYTVGLDVVVNSRIGCGGKLSVWSWW